MGNSTQKQYSFHQDHMPQPKDKNYLSFQIYKNRKGQSILMKQIQAIQQSQQFQSIQVRFKHRNRFNYVYPLQCYNQSKADICNNMQKIILASVRPAYNLQMLIEERRRNNESFNSDQINLIIKNVCLALKELDDKNQKLCFLEENRIFIQDNVYLMDPFLAENNKLKFNKNRYPSPQQMQNRNSSSYKQKQIISKRLFSLGLICLSVCNIQTRISQSYTQGRQNQQKIDFGFLYRHLQQVKDSQIRHKIEIMLDVNPMKRLQIYQLISKERINPINVHFLKKMNMIEQNQGSRSSLRSQQTCQMVKKYSLVNLKTSNYTNKSQQAFSNTPKSNTSMTIGTKYMNRSQINYEQIKFSRPSLKNTQNNLNKRPLIIRQSFDSSKILTVSHVNPNNPTNNLSVKAPQYKIQINQVKGQKQLQNNKENIPAPLNTLNTKSKSSSQSNLLNKPHKQFKNNSIPQNTPIKQKKKHYFSTIKEVSENDDIYSEQRRMRDSGLDLQLSGRFQGSVVSGMKNGRGIFYFSEGCIYDGEWKDNKMTGFGVLKYPNGKIAYEGQWLNNQFHGYGKVYNDDPKILVTQFPYQDFNYLEQQWIMYQGQLVQDKKEGYGKFYLSNHEYYEGSFKNDKIEGEGVYHTMNGQAIRGIWSNNILQHKIL